MSVTPNEPSGAPAPSATDPFAGVDPCDLVAEETRLAFNLTDPESKQVGEALVCRFRIEGDTLRSSYAVGIELFATRGIDEVVAPDIVQIPDIGEHTAIQFSGANGGCAVGLGVGVGSRVDVTAVGGDYGPACDIVSALAAAVEPAIP